MRDRKGLVIRDGLDGETGCHRSQERKVYCPAVVLGAHQFNGTAFVVGLPDVALAFQIAQMLVYGGERRVAEGVGDLLEARGVAILVDEFFHMIEDLSLSFCQRHAHHLHVLRTRIRPEQIIAERYPKSKVDPHSPGGLAEGVGR